jgi:hypothetical protein
MSDYIRGFELDIGFIYQVNTQHVTAIN